MEEEGIGGEGWRKGYEGKGEGRINKRGRVEREERLNRV